MGKCAQYVEQGNVPQIWSHVKSPFQCRACKCRKVGEGSDDDRDDTKKVNGLKGSRRVKKIGRPREGLKPVKLFD